MKKLTTILFILIGFNVSAQFNLTLKKLTVDSVNARTNYIWLNDTAQVVEDILIRDTSIVDLIKYYGAEGVVSLGNVGQMPFMNSGGTDFDYGDVKYNGTDNSLTIGRRLGTSGAFSRAFGINSEASGVISTVFSSQNEASGDYSMAWGTGSVASGKYSTAFGNLTSSSGESSIACGGGSVASGDYSTAIGGSVESNDYAEFVIGLFNKVGTGNKTSFASEDNLFTVGGGFNEPSRVNLFQIKKDGTTYINDSTIIVTEDTTFIKNHVKIDSNLYVNGFIDFNGSVVTSAMASAYIEDGGQASTTISAADTYYFLKGAFTNVKSIDFMLSGDTLMYSGSSDVSLTLNYTCTFSVGQVNTTVTTAISINDIINSQSINDRKISATSDKGAWGGLATVSLKYGDKIKLVVSSDKTGTVTAERFSTILK